MSTGNGGDPQQALHRLEELIRALDGHPDPSAKETARELLALVLDLHGIGLAKLMGIVTTAEGGTSILARLVEDKQVQAILLLHGLHPDDLQRAFAGRGIGCDRILGFTASAWTLWKSHVAPFDCGRMEAALPRSRRRC